LKYDYLAPGTEVKVTAGSDQVMATVAALPLVNSKPASEQIGA
jgi:hypothetical protein